MSCQQDGEELGLQFPPGAKHWVGLGLLPGPRPSRSLCSLLAQPWQLGKGLQDDAHPPLPHTREGGTDICPKLVCPRPGIDHGPNTFSMKGIWLWSLTPHYPRPERQLRLLAAKGAPSHSCCSKDPGRQLKAGLWSRQTPFCGPGQGTCPSESPCQLGGMHTVGVDKCTSPGS